MNRTPRHRQSGTALVVAMLFLVILGMLGVTTMTATTLEERMAGNTRDRDVAMQAAEAALRDAERDISNTVPANGRVVSVGMFDAVCTSALCTEGVPVLTNVDDTAKSAFLGQFTGELAMMQGPAVQPRYVVELLNTLPPQVPVPPAGQQVRDFRITAKGYGRNTNTIVILQTVFRMTL